MKEVEEQLPPVVASVEERAEAYVKKYLDDHFHMIYEAHQRRIMPDAVVYHMEQPTESALDMYNEPGSRDTVQTHIRDN